MFELRWLEEPVKTCGNENCTEKGCEGTTKVLQFRQKEYYIKMMSGDIVVQLPEQWTEWKNVPTEASA